jgi:16S rRNA (uracil1498-N3)-methyltransferase
LKIVWQNKTQQLLKNKLNRPSILREFQEICTMHRFYAEQLESNSKFVTLNDVESNHACKVLRLTESEKVEIINGNGLIAAGTIIHAHHKRCELSIESIDVYEKPDKKIHLAICPTKSNDRFEWMLEKIVEIGVDTITPLVSENSERSKLNYERLEKIILSATKQSLRAFMPKLMEQQKVSNFIVAQPYALLAHCNEAFERKWLQPSAKVSETIVMIGPEGDFSKKEIELALHHGLKSVSLGNNRLRTETAGLVAVTLLKLSEI